MRPYPYSAVYDEWLNATMDKHDFEYYFGGLPTFSAKIVMLFGHKLSTKTYTHAFSGKNLVMASPRTIRRARRKLKKDCPQFQKNKYVNDI